MEASVLIAHRMDAEVLLNGVPKPYRSQAVAAWRTTAAGPRRVLFQATTVAAT